jgi:hypothetical protein
MPAGSKATDLMVASRNGDAPAVEKLLAAGADVNARDSVCGARGRARATPDGRGHGRAAQRWGLTSACCVLCFRTGGLDLHCLRGPERSRTSNQSAAGQDR